MAVVLGVLALLVWIALQLHMKKNGIEPMTRGQARYLRKKARKTGLSLDRVPYKPRRRK